MPRKFRLPEGIARRFFLAGGVLFPFAVYMALRALPITREHVLALEARTVRVATRTKQAVQYVFLNKAMEENALWSCREEVKEVAQELAEVRATNAGPVRTFPVGVIARTYAGEEQKLLVWNTQTQDPFMVGEGVGAGKILFGVIVEAKKDLAVVQTTTHKASAIPAMISGKEETIGIAEGTGGAWLELAYVPKGSSIAVGDTVVTSGMGGGMIRGLILGIVQEIIDADPSPFYRIKVEPLVYSDDWWDAEVFHLPTL